MPGKKRSGLANDRRAYGCGIICYTPNPCPVAINITSIATYNGEGTYTLISNYTITECQILNIPVGTILGIIEGQTLTNSGTINNSGTIDNSGYLYNDGGTINNSGTIDNGGGTIATIGFIYTYGGGTINNTGGTIFNNPGGTISTSNGGACGAGTFTGTNINNTGTINTNCPP